MIRLKNFIEYIIKVIAIIFLSSKISLADFDNGMDAINEGNYEKAITELKPMADQGDPRAQFWYGNLIFNGLGTPKNMKLGMEFYRLSAEKNFPLALHELGHVYHHALGVEQDIEEAINWYEKAITEGKVVYSYHNLGMIYHYGSNSIESNANKAIELYEKAANLDYIGSMQNLGIVYSDGIIVKKDIQKALYWFNKAASKGLPQAYHRLSLIYGNGDGVDQNYKEAIRLTNLAANAGVIEAQHNLGYFYNYGLWGLEQNYQIAFVWYKKAAESGFPDSQINLGILFDEGLGIEVDDKKALKYYKLAADQNHPKGQYLLAMMHEYGEGTTQNLELAKDYYYRAANQGHSDSQYRLAMLYINMNTKLENPNLPEILLQLAAQQRHQGAWFQLGMMYYNGTNTIKKDKIYSLMWFMLASATDDKQAIENRDIIIQELSDNEVKIAIELNKRCLDRNFQNCSDFFK